MLKKDYIVRQTEEFGKFIATVFGLKSRGRWTELEDLLRTSAIKYTNVEIEVAETLDTDRLVETLIADHKLKEPNLKMLADLLYEKGMAYSNQLLEEKARNAFEKALLIYEYIKDNSLEIDFSLDRHFKMNSLRQLLNK